MYEEEEEWVPAIVATVVDPAAATDTDNDSDLDCTPALAAIPCESANEPELPAAATTKGTQPPS